MTGSRKMADDIDRANIINEQLREMALAEHFRKAGSSPQPAAPSPLVCTSCGGSIPERRILAMPGCERCISCQIEFEMGESRRRKF